ncbi:MAG TPA: amidohydrolase [Solibacterales bacterium]|nr:amidohydrolase [Bryobacterales bacterium]
MRICVSWFFLFAALCGAQQPADWIVTARFVVTMDPTRRVIENGAVAVGAGRILAVGPRTEIDRRYRAKQRLDRPESLLAPGLINTHTHAPMSLLRGIADDLRLQEWLEKYIFPAEAKNVTPDFVRWGTRLAALEMMLSGTTTFADMYYFEEVIAEAAKEAGLRGVLGQTVIGFPVPDAKTPEIGLARTGKFLERFRGDPLITAAVAPHSMYTVSPETLKATRALANRHGAPLLIHVAETLKEREDSLTAHRQSPVQYLDRLGVFDGRTLAAHCVHVDEDDIRLLAHRGVGVAHCPSSNMKLASGAAPVAALLEADVAVGLGPDGPAGSNNDFSLFEEMDLAAKLQKLVRRDPQALPARTAFEMATVRGARALGMEKEIGSLEPGKRADLITVRLDRPHAVPMWDVYSQLVYASKGADVLDVFVQGRLIVRGARPLTMDPVVVLQKAREYQRSIRQSLSR